MDVQGKVVIPQISRGRGLQNPGSRYQRAHGNGDGGLTPWRDKGYETD